MYFSKIPNYVTLENFASINTNLNEYYPNNLLFKIKSTALTAIFVLKNDFNADSTVFINGMYSDRVYLYNDNKLIAESGTMLPIQKKSVPGEANFLKITLKAGELGVFKLKAIGHLQRPVDTPFYVYSEKYFLQSEITDLPIQYTYDNIVIFYFGGVTLLMFFFLFMYYRSRQALYGRYSLYLFFQWMFGLIKLSSFTLIGWQMLKYPFFRIALVEPVVLCGVGAYVWFAIELLNLKATRFKMYKGLKLMAKCLWIYAGLYFVYFYLYPHYQIQGVLFLIVRAILIPINIYLLIMIAKHIKTPGKPYYIIGNVLFIGFAILAGVEVRGSLFDTGYFSRFNGTLYYMIGILLEIVFFAFALGTRLRGLFEEKELADKKLIEQMHVNEKLMKDINTELEIKVRERTATLRLQEKQIEEAKELETKTSYEKQLAEIKMTALRSRMNPHFIFNSLNSIKYFILKTDNDSAEFYLNRFSKLLRMILEYSNNEKITLNQELEALKIYLEIESLRFDQSFHYEINIDKNINIDTTLIPPLLLQPFVENAIWHGLANSDKEEKYCKIEGVKNNGTIALFIKDNGVGRKITKQLNENKPNKHSSFGMKITDERVNLYNAFNDDTIHIEIIDEEDNKQNAMGTTVIITCKNTA